ncbi:glycosyltransferase [Streptomyces sp. NPDC057748]|uniref:glycosyltransferase family 2 protein n=1 Tax=Streptomyces sp. NPDC057748 TaxID=3346239 RepID=UPI0036AFEF97
MLLSVVVPVHRVQGYLRAAIESVLDQIPGEPELLAVDDGSRDGSARRAAGSEADALRAGTFGIDGLSTGALCTDVPRLCRRAFWTGHGLHFTDGPYADVLPVHRATLLAADAGTLDTLDRVCVRHRRSGDTPGAVSTTEDELLELFRERFCPYDDGHAAERVVRRLFLGDSDGDSCGDHGDSEPDRTATGARPMSPVRERPGPVTPGPSRG